MPFKVGYEWLPGCVEQMFSQSVLRIDILCPWLLLDAPIQRDVTILLVLHPVALRFRAAVKSKSSAVDCITLPFSAERLNTMSRKRNMHA